MGSLAILVSVFIGCAQEYKPYHRNQHSVTVTSWPVVMAVIAHVGRKNMETHFCAANIL